MTTIGHVVAPRPDAASTAASLEIARLPLGPLARRPDGLARIAVVPLDDAVGIVPGKVFRIRRRDTGLPGPQERVVAARRAHGR